MRRYRLMIAVALLAVVLLGGCAGASAARDPEEISAVWTAGDDAPLPGAEQAFTEGADQAAQEPSEGPEAP